MKVGVFFFKVLYRDQTNQPDVKSFSHKNSVHSSGCQALYLCLSEQDANDISMILKITYGKVSPASQTSQVAAALSSQMRR